MRKFANIMIKLYQPADEQSATALANAIADAHAAAVINYIKSLDCSADTKVKLLDSTLKINK